MGPESVLQRQAKGERTVGKGQKVYFCPCCGPALAAADSPSRVMATLVLDLTPTSVQIDANEKLRLGVLNLLLLVFFVWIRDEFQCSRRSIYFCNICVLR